MKSRPRKPLVPRSANGSLDRKAPHWRGDTAEKIVARRLEEIEREAKAAPKRRRRSKTSGSSSRSSSGDRNDPMRVLKRLERNIKRRKTLAARQRLQKRIDDLRKELGL